MIISELMPATPLRWWLLAAMLFSTASSVAVAKTVGGCDEGEVVAAKKEFEVLRNARRSAPGSVPDGEFKAAARRYIGLADACYIEKHGASEGHPIDDGGVWAPGFPGRFALTGSKWGAGSPFPGGVNVPGPRIPGGIVTWSLMADGVQMSDAPDNNTAIASLPTFDSCFLSEIQTAFDAWAAVADISFTQVADSGSPFDFPGASGDIRIGAHTFDGPSSVLAHGYFPPPNGSSAAGDLHFDIAENWQCTGGPGEMDFGVVAAHEIGHAIGLNHETTEPALMQPIYNPAVTTPLADDILGAENIYGTSGALFSLTLFFDPERDLTFNSTPIDFFQDSTFTTGDGGTGKWEALDVSGLAVSLTFTNGCAPLYAGGLFGFFKCSDGSQPPSQEPGYYFLGAAGALQALGIGAVEQSEGGSAADPRH